MEKLSASIPSLMAGRQAHGAGGGLCGILRLRSMKEEHVENGMQKGLQDYQKMPQAKLNSGPRSACRKELQIDTMMKCSAGRGGVE